MLPADLTTAPGVAKMPLPMTRDMIKMYALLHPKLRPSTAVSGSTSSSRDRVDAMVPGWVLAEDCESSKPW